MYLVGLVVLCLVLWVTFGLVSDAWRAAARTVAEPESNVPPLLDGAIELVSDAERWVKLSEQCGIEQWLDLCTGRILTHPGDLEAPPALEPLMPIVQAALKERGLLYLPYGDAHLLVPCREPEARYTMVLTVMEEERRLEAWCSFGAMVPEAAREAVGTVVERLNVESTGSVLRIDENGDVIIVCGVLLPGEPLSYEMVYEVLGILRNDASRAHHPVMRVAFGGLSPEEALAEEDLW